MKILLASSQPYLPESAGGTQVNTHETAIELIKYGHHIAVSASVEGIGWAGFRYRSIIKLSKLKALVSHEFGYPVYRAWDAVLAFSYCLVSFRPEIIIIPTTQGIPLIKIAEAHKIPVIVYLHDVELDDLGGDVSELKADRYLANSEFTSSVYRAAAGIQAVVIPPLFKRTSYYVERNPKFVTFVNPHPKKGVRGQPSTEHWNGSRPQHKFVSERRDVLMR